MAQIEVKLLNNYAGNEESKHSVTVGTKALDFVAQKLPHTRNSSQKSVIRVRRAGEMFGSSAEPIDPNFMLAEGDLVSVTPEKTAGAY